MGFIGYNGETPPLRFLPSARSSDRHFLHWTITDQNVLMSYRPAAYLRFRMPDVIGALAALLVTPGRNVVPQQHRQISHVDRINFAQVRGESPFSGGNTNQDLPTSAPPVGSALLGMRPARISTSDP